MTTPVKLDLEECFQNGPPFQSHLLNNENYILTCEGLLKAFSKTSKQAVESGEMASKATKAVAEAIEAVGKFESQIGEDSSGIIVQLSEILKAIEFDRREMELKRKYEKDKLDFGYAYSRYMSKKPKDVGVLESAQEVANLRRELHETSLSLAIHLNEMIDKKSTFVYQSVSNYLNCRLEFAEREAAKLKEIKGHLDKLASEKIVTPDEHKERLMKNFIQKNTIISRNSQSYNPLTNDPVNAVASNIPRRSGYLYKRSSHALRPVWSRRFFSLNGDRLIYYSLEGKGDQARVGIDLRLCHVQAVDDPERRYCFDLISPIRGYRLQAENENDLNGWLAAIKSGTILALQKSASGLSNPAKALSKEFGLVKETGHEDLIHSILSMNQIELSLSNKRKEEIFEVEGNRECADCHMKGIHRSLGVHLSKVRSLALDFWNPEHVELMKCIGNSKSWNIFEEGYEGQKADNAKLIKAEPDSSQQVKEKWILAKYVNRQYVKFPGSQESTEDEKVEYIRTMMWDALEKDDVVECLRALALGASVDDTCESSEDESCVQSAVQRAAQLKHWNMVALLLLWGADAEYRDSLGRNLIHYLASIEDSSISVLLSVLRKNPALGGWTDAEGRSPLLYAEMTENAPVATIIRVFQAQVDESSATRGVRNNNSGQESPSLTEPKQISVLSTQAMLGALMDMSTGNDDRSGGGGWLSKGTAAATINWILKDGLGQAGGIALVSLLGSRLDSQARFLRFHSTVLFLLGSLLEFSIPFAGTSMFLLLASTANILKNVSWMVVSATRAHFMRNFALKGNLGDLTGKAASQMTLASLVGTGLGLAVLKAEDIVEVKGLLVAGCWALSAAVGLVATHRSCKVGLSRQLNPQRIFKIMETFSKHRNSEKGQVSRYIWTPEIMASRENIVIANRPVSICFNPPLSTLSNDLNWIVPIDEIESKHFCLSKSTAATEGYTIWTLDTATTTDKLLAIIKAAISHYKMEGIDETEVLEALKGQGWDVEHFSCKELDDKTRTLQIAKKID